MARTQYRKFGKYTYARCGYKETKREAQERVKELNSHSFLARYTPLTYKGKNDGYVIWRISKSDVSRINYPNAGRGR